jgi:hypothetical protein
MSCQQIPLRDSGQTRQADRDVVGAVIIGLPRGEPSPPGRIIIIIAALHLTYLHN